MPKTDDSNPSVFICYAKEDHAFACEIFATLRTRGVAVWMDHPPEAFALEGILPGQDTALRIEQQVAAAGVLLLLLSSASIAQQSYVQAEFRLALHAAARRGISTVAVLQNACEPPTFIAESFSLDQLTWIDYSRRADAIFAAIRTARAPLAKSISPAPAKSGRAVLLPRIRWRAFVGRLHWRNTIALEQGRLYVTSCGARWNQDDRGDGVYCLDAQSGAMKWAFNSAGDANEALIHNDRVVVGTDAGQLAVIDKATGSLKQGCRVWHPIFARPFVLQADGGSRPFAISHKGVVLAVDAAADKIAEEVTLPFPLRANPVPTADGRSAILFGETGEIARAWCENGAFRWEMLAIKSYRPPGASARRHAGLVAPPLIDGECVIGGAVRDRYYEVAPLFRFDLSDKSFAWGEREEEPRGEHNAFGNLRSQPLLMGDDVIFAPAYAAAIFAADRKTGEIRWKLPVGKELLQQWSSPVKVDEQRILLARADGVLYQIDIAAQKIEWALSLLVTPSEMQAANRAGRLGPGPSEAMHNGITATPARDDGRIYVGTTEGELFCIEDAG
jgi:outer membrane protein assembly factor BamB